MRMHVGVHAHVCACTRARICAAAPPTRPDPARCIRACPPPPSYVQPVMARLQGLRALELACCAPGAASARPEGGALPQRAAYGLMQTQSFASMNLLAARARARGAGALAHPPGLSAPPPPPPPCSAQQPWTRNSLEPARPTRWHPLFLPPTYPPTTTQAQSACIHSSATHLT